MPHPLSGFLEVDESARTVRHYRYAVERMMRILGGWIALTPELSVKLLLGRHVWDNAQHADLWGKRLPELRAAAQISEPANARLVAFMHALEAAEAPGETIERAVGGGGGGGLMGVGEGSGGWAVARELAAALGAFGDALATGDPEGARRWLEPAVETGPDLQGRLLAVRGGRHRVVAFARVGQQRLVKLQLDGGAESLTLLLRWVLTGAGWRVAALEPVVASAAQTA